MGDKLLGYGVEPEGGWSGGRSRGGMGGTEEYDGVMMTTQKGWAHHTLDDLLDWLVGGNSHVASMYRPEIVSVAGGVTPPPRSWRRLSQSSRSCRPGFTEEE